MVMARGRVSYRSALEALQKTPRQVFATCDLRAREAALEAFAYYKLGRGIDSESSMRRAEVSCQSPEPALSTDLESMRGQISDSWLGYEIHTRAALVLAQQQHDTFREAGALNNLAVASLGQQHYDELIDFGENSLAISRREGYELYAEKVAGTLGLAYYKLGDFERAAQLLHECDEKARRIDAGTDSLQCVGNLGLVYEDLGQLSRAESSYREALAAARKQEDAEQTTIALAELSYVSIRNSKWEQAEDFTRQALDQARKINDGPMELEALLAQGLIAAHNGDQKTSERLLRQVASDTGYESESPRWEAQSQLASLYAKEQKMAAAQAEYQVALKTVRDARCSVKKESLRLPFFAGATRVYDSYIDFLVGNGKFIEGLQVADESRALTLAEGLGVEGKKCLATETVFNPQRSAKQAEATILFYWLGAEHSHLWAVAPDRVKHYSLSAASQINSTVEAYRKALVGSRDVLQSGDANGAALYQALVAPAEEFYLRDAQPKGRRVIVIADGSLSGLNFETLIAPSPKPHYWIEDVCVENASSLRLLAAGSRPHSRPSGRLLLIGNPVPPQGSDFAALPNAAKEMQSVRRFFQDGAVVYEKLDSTPAAYTGSHPEQFAYIHFVAHGVASLTDPLESAVVLSQTPVSAPAPGSAKGASADKDGGYKLYARDVMTLPLKAELVTVSTCKGAGVRQYTGEGLVGLSWAFLHAGAHHVIGALWDVSDESTPVLMSAMYGELVKGSPPEAALRTAKLALLNSGAPFRKPYYWAPFQLYM